MLDITKNNFFDGSVTIFQNKNGYRFSLDPILLASHIHPGENSKVLDIGTGSAIIPISLLYKNNEINFSVTGIEIQQSLFEIAVMNKEINNLSSKLTIINKNIMDISQQDLGGPVDIITSNPPYQKIGAGRINPQSEKAMARHEINLNIDDLLIKSRSLLKNKGKFFVIYPANRASELIAKMEFYKIVPKEIRFVHSFKNTQAVMVICQGISNGNQGVSILPPLIIYDKEKEYTDEVLKIMS